MNSDGTVIQVSLKPGADRDKVVEEVRRILREEAEDRTVVPLRGQEASEALRQEWRGDSRVAETSEAGPEAVELQATEPRPPNRWWLLGLMLALTDSVLAYVAWRRYWAIGDEEP